MPHYLKSFGYLLGALFFVHSNAQATTVVALDLQELVGGSTEIVLAKVIGQRYLRSDNGKPLTESTLQIHDGYKGSCRRGEIVTIVQPGGVIDGIGMHVAGTTPFKIGERYLLFAQSHARLDDAGIRLSPIGMAQGAMKVKINRQGHQTVFPGVAINTLKDDGRGGYSENKPAIHKPVALKDLLNRVQTYIASQRASHL